MKTELNIFVAGSKELRQERMICRTVCNRLQNQWGTIITKTYEDFLEIMSKVGHQNEYNDYIINDTDIAIFIFANKAGETTLLELKLAYNSYLKKKHPQILVYIKAGEESNDIAQLRQTLTDKGQYYIEYSDNNQLENLVEQHLNKLLIDRVNNKKKDKLFSVLSFTSLIMVVWCIFGFIGAIGMYIYDAKMSNSDCINIAAKYVECGSDGEYIYYFPNETLFYNTNDNTLVSKKRENNAPSADLTLSKTEHVAFGITATLLITRVFNTKISKPKGKTILIYVGVVAATVVGCGVGCVVEQIIFPPQYSIPVRKCLYDKSNWDIVISKRNPTVLF